MSSKTAPWVAAQNESMCKANLAGSVQQAASGTEQQAGSKLLSADPPRGKEIGGVLKGTWMGPDGMQR